jgi:hypothetical protein
MTTIIKCEPSEEPDSILASPTWDKTSSSRAASITGSDSAATEDLFIADYSPLDGNPTLTLESSNQVDNQLPSTNLGDDHQTGCETDPYEVASSTGGASQSSSESIEKKRKLSDTDSSPVGYESKEKGGQRRLAETQLYQAFLSSPTASRQLSMARHAPIISQ